MIRLEGLEQVGTLKPTSLRIVLVISSQKLVKQGCREFLSYFQDDSSIVPSIALVLVVCEL